MYCNKCGKKIRQDFDMRREDCIFVEKNWGYFSRKDGQTHQFCLCEDCYDEWVMSFKIPVKKKDTTELL